MLSKKQKHSAPCTAAQVANVFLQLARSEGKVLSNMQLQKLVYIAHGYFLAVLNRPLFSDDIQAWNYGPVIPSLYQALKQYGAGDVTDYIPTDEEIETPSAERNIIEHVWELHRNLSALELSTLTHETASPWSKVGGSSAKHTVIPASVMKEYYTNFIKR